jgi:hypothetical protein
VTLAAWLIMVGSAIVVAMVFERIGGLHTMETRESVERFLAEPPGADLGIDVDGAITVLRVVSMVAAGCATAAGILGYQLLRRSRSARLALTLLAVPLFLTGMVTGGFVSSVVAASAVMLWLQPSRSWFEGGAPGVPAPPAARSVAPPSGQPVTQPVTQPATQSVTQSVTQPAARPAPERPPAVVVACVLTWLCSGLAALGLVLSAAVLAVDPDVLVDEAHKQRPDLAEQGVSDGLLIGVALAMIAALVLWCVAAGVLAVLVYRRVDWARVVLLVSAGITAGLCLIGLVAGGFLLVVPLVAAVATFVLLVRPDTRPWFQQPR